MGADETTTKRTRSLPHLESRLFDTPHLLMREKADVIRAAFVERLDRISADPLAFFFDDEDEEEQDKARYELVDGVAVLSVSGTLVQRSAGMNALSGLKSYSEIGQDLDAALADPQVEAVLLDLDSPGGECGGCFELVDKVFAARATKPIHAVANPLACSAAYALASAAERLTVPAVSYVGSIGVITVHRDQSKYDEKLGVSYTSIYAGERKNDGDPHAPLPDEARAAIQSRIDQIYEVFVGAVARNRGLDPAAVKATQAGVFLGEEAVKAGLADAVGSRDDAIAALKAAAEERRMLEQLKQQVATLTGERDALVAKAAGLETTLAELRARDEQRQKDADAAWLEQLVQGQADAQAPLLAEEQASIKEQLDAGNRAAAKSLAKAFTGLARTRAGQGSAKSAGLAPAAPTTKTPAQGEAEILERKGWKVLLSEDKATILEATPPEMRS